MVGALFRSWLALVLVAASMNAQFAGSCESSICTVARTGRLADLQWPDFSRLVDKVQDFYKSRNGMLAWTSGGKPTTQAESILEILQDAAVKGLDAEDYDGSRWPGRLTELRNAQHTSSELDLDRFDLAVTVSLMRYISDLHFGKANPGVFGKSPDFETAPDSMTAFIRERVVTASNMKLTLEDIEPPYAGYRRTLGALQHYLTMAESNDLGTLPLLKASVKPGASYVEVAQLAAILHRLGDLPKDAIPVAGSTIYEGALVNAVKHFQARHGLEPDGVLGKATLAQINTPLRRRVRQLQLTLERWRWIPHRFSSPLIVVNIPEFRLRGLDASYNTELEMKVIVGANSFDHRTPNFSAEMQQVTFHPYWRVPISIQRAELVPKLENDRSYLVKNRYDVVTLEDEVVSDGVVTDKILEKLRSGRLRLRQRPGPENALGLVAFSFPNKYGVFLHATPATELFAKPRRDFSQGCIRAEKPEQLANWALQNMPEWTPSHIASAMGDGTDDGKPIVVTLAKPIPVLVVYATAVVLENGEVQFFDDIYKEDVRLEQILAKGYAHTTESLPVPHASHIHVNEIGSGVVSDTTAAKQDSQIAKLGRVYSWQPDVNRFGLHVQARLGNPGRARPQILVRRRRSIPANHIDFGIRTAAGRDQFRKKIEQARIEMAGRSGEIVTEKPVQPR